MYKNINDIHMILLLAFIINSFNTWIVPNRWLDDTLRIKVIGKMIKNALKICQIV